MTNIRLVGPRISALFPTAAAAGEDDTNSGCHGNTDGVDPNSKVILAHVRLMVVCWGKYYEQHPDAADNAYALCRDLVTGPYLNGLAQYGVGRGSMAGSAIINANAAAPANLSEDEARDSLLSWLGGNSPLAPAVNENSLLYILFLPPETKPSIASGKDDFCGYHHWAKLHDESDDSDVFWALIRTDSADQTSGATFIQSVSGCVSHEIAEAVTSRDGRGYFKGSCEVGDLCEQTGLHAYKGWQVEQYWSDWDAQCVDGEKPISLKRFLRARDIGNGSLLSLHAHTINGEYVASQFR